MNQTSLIRCWSSWWRNTKANQHIHFSRIQTDRRGVVSNACAGLRCTTGVGEEGAGRIIIMHARGRFLSETTVCTVSPLLFNRNRAWFLTYVLLTVDEREQLLMTTENSVKNLYDVLEMSIHLFHIIFWKIFLRVANISS